jgi:hypothetical protein
VAVATRVVVATPVIEGNIAAEHVATVRPDVITNVIRNVTATSSPKYFFDAAQSTRVETPTPGPGRTPPLSSHGDIGGDIVMRS